MKKFVCANRTFVSGKPLIMGIVNVTPDSFSDGGKLFGADGTDVKKTVERIFELAENGADIIDIGAVSTRPGSSYVSPEEEINRLADVLKAVLGENNSLKAAVSVDTFNPQTAEFALELGVDIINDVSGAFNPRMAETVKKYSAGWILTHTAAVPSSATVNYPNGVTKAVDVFFGDMLKKCEFAGIDKSSVCLDPGFGFAKTTDDNVELLKNMRSIVRDDVFFLCALSRKRFVGEICGEPVAENRLAGTLAANYIAALSGADIVRVHDVRQTAQFFAMMESVSWIKLL